MFVYSFLQSGLVLVVTLRGMNNTDQTEVTAVHSVLAQRASPRMPGINAPLILVFLFSSHLQLLDHLSGEIKERN